jgi:transcriptional regulator with XRE-family HTH domain
VILGSDTAAIVQELRRVRGLSQQAIAARAGLSQSAVAGIESGRRSASLTTLVRLAKAAGLQLRVEMEPLDADVLGALDDAQAVEQSRAAVGQALRALFGLAFGVQPPEAYRVEGAAAVALLGAPLKVPKVSIALADNPASLEWLTQRSNPVAMVAVYRADPDLDPWQCAIGIPPYDRSRTTDGDLDARRRRRTSRRRRHGGCRSVPGRAARLPGDH